LSFWSGQLIPTIMSATDRQPVRTLQVDSRSLREPLAMPSDPRVHIPLGVFVTLLGYLRRCKNRSSLFGARSLALDLLVERLGDRA
jgi:hypothetical protein